MTVEMIDGNALGLTGKYAAYDTCSVIYAESASPLATFADDYMRGSPAVTVNTAGSGTAYYLAARLEGCILGDFYARLIDDLSIARALDGELPPPVSAQMRTDGENEYVFVMNFSAGGESVRLNSAYRDLLSDREANGELTLEPYGVMVLSPRRTEI